MSRVLVALVLLIWPQVGNSLTVLINNGLAPPNPENVFTGNLNGTGDLLLVHNLGCGSVDGSGNLTSATCSSSDPPPTSVLYTGHATRISVLGSSNLETRGSKSAHITVGGSSTATLFSGADQEIQANGQSTVLLFAPTQTLRGLGESHTTIPNAFVEEIIAEDSATIDIFGGQLGSGTAASDDLFLFDSSQVTIYGDNFQVDGIPVPFGPVSVTDGVLTGSLQNGSNLFLVFSRTQSSSLVLAPEPGTGMLLTLGVLLMAGRKSASTNRRAPRCS